MAQSNEITFFKSLELFYGVIAARLWAAWQKLSHWLLSSSLPPGVWLHQRPALGREHLVRVQGDGLVQDGSAVPDQELLRETRQRHAPAALQRKQLRAAGGEFRSAGLETGQLEAVQRRRRRPAALQARQQRQGVQQQPEFATHPPWKAGCAWQGGSGDFSRPNYNCQ